MANMPQPRARLFVNAHQASAITLRLAAALGVGGVRVDANWPDLQPAPDRFTWSWLDDLLATCGELNLHVYCSLSQTPAWLSVNRQDLPPLHDWIVFCSKFAQYFKGRVTYVGCWNEPSFEPKDYVNRLLHPMADIFKTVDRNFQICGPEWQTVGRWWEPLDGILTNGHDDLDIVTVHAYGKDCESTWDKLTKDRDKRIPLWFPWPSPSILQVIRQADWHGPVWVTETGFKSDVLGEDGQAEEMENLLVYLDRHAQLHGMAIFHLIDEQEPDESESKWGLYRQDGSIKPAGLAVKRHTGGMDAV